MRSVEQRLFGPDLWIVKVAEADSHWSKSSAQIQNYSRAERQSNFGQLFAGSGRRGPCVTTCEYLKLSGLQLQDHGTSNPRPLARCGPRLLSKTPNHGLGFRQQYILLESIFGGDRLCWPVRHDWVLVDAARQFVEALPVTPEGGGQVLKRTTTLFPDSSQSKICELSSVTLPTPGMRPTSKGVKKFSTSAGWITNKPFGFRQSEAISPGTCWERRQRRP